MSGSHSLRHNSLFPPGYLKRSTHKAAMHWSDCNDELKMNEFIREIHDEPKLRRFAFELAKSVLKDLKDQRLIDVVDAVASFLSGEIQESQLLDAYQNAELALDAISASELELPDQVTDSDMDYEKAAVAVWSALPPTLGHCDSTVEAARESALHTAHYCRLIRGDDDLHDQVEVLRAVGLPVTV